MFKNYLTVAIRNLARHKAYSFINVIGLTIGLACSIVLTLFIKYEFSYDRHHSKADCIHTVIRAQHDANNTTLLSPLVKSVPPLENQFDNGSHLE